MFATWISSMEPARKRVPSNGVAPQYQSCGTAALAHRLVKSTSPVLESSLPAM